MGYTIQLLLLLPLLSFQSQLLFSLDEEDPRLEEIQSCMNFEGTVCIGGNSFLAPTTMRSADDSLLAHFDFSNDLGFDISLKGKFNLEYDKALMKQLVPSFDGSFAQELTGEKYLELPLKESVLKTYAVSFWIFIAKVEETTTPQLLLSLGQSIEQFDFQLFMMTDGQLHLKLGDRSTSDSHSRLKIRQWNLITVNVLENKMIQVFHNAKLAIDLFVGETNVPFYGKGSFYMGGDPWHGIQYLAFMDDLKLFSTTLSSGWQLKELDKIYNVRGFFNRVDFGCESTLIFDAPNCCKAESDHICSKNEMFQGGYRVGKMMGWIVNNEFTSVWLNEDTQTSESEKQEMGDTRKKVLCCANNNL